MRRRLTPIFLVVAGCLAGLIGAGILLVPRAFFATNHITLEADPNLMSEIRAPGGLLLAAALAMVAGGFNRKLAQPGLITAVFVFGMYGIARLFSLVVDGVPSASLVGALILEAVLAFVALALLERSHKQSAD